MIKKRYKKFTAGIALFGQLNKDEDRDVIEAYLFPHYQMYAESASQEFQEFYALYDPSGPSYLLKEDNLSLLLEEISILKQRYKDDAAIFLELHTFELMIEKLEDADGFLIMVTPYPGHTISFYPIPGAEIDAEIS